VPLNRPAEPLAPGPRGAMQARRWMAQVCLEIGRPELRENAELALSELVTNAILHGRAPVTVRLRGTADHPRVEVRDGSPDPPAFPSTEIGQQFLDELPTFGRGLGIVASSSEAWGAERDGDGKLVWFAPTPVPPAKPAPGVLLGWDDDPDDLTADVGGALVVRLLHVPTASMQATLAHGAELRRELRLLALAHHDTYPVAAELSAFFSQLATDFRGQLGGEAMLQALRTGQQHLDLDVKAPLDSEQRFQRLMELLDLADAFCHNERLLTLARTPELVMFQRWLFGEFVRQAAGEDPVPWSGDEGDRLARTGQP
jgi:anti-sigma regulatory factor (Ser/Thr protein kinase)